MAEITDTHRRAALRGRASLAEWRIQGGVWAGRLYATLFAVLTIIPLLRRGSPDWASVVVLAVVAVALLFATERMRRGSRVAACFLLGLFVVARLGSWLLGGQPLWQGLIINLLVLGALANAVWGTFALEAVRREAVHVPPAPARPRDPAAAFRRSAA